MFAEASSSSPTKNWQPSRPEAARELLARRRARRSYQAFTERILGDFRQARHHLASTAKLEAIERGEIKRLMVFMPPGSAKSTYANWAFVPWYLGRHPDHNIIAASYGQELADRWGRRSRNIIATEDYRAIFGFGLADDSSAANRWATERGGEYVAAGVGGPIMGNRADLAVIDDPVKGIEEAASESFRRKQKDWWNYDLWPRLKPDASIILIMTRWHEDDLAGWLLAEQDRGGERWEVLSLPAIAEDDDPLGRAPGESLWPEWFTPEDFAEAKRDARRWASLYQQRPAPEEGDFFKREWLKECDRIPDEKTLHVYGASDYAVTADGGDYTVHIVVGVDPSERMYVLDLWRGRTASNKWVEQWCRLVKRHKPLQWAEEAGQIKGGVGPFRDQIAREKGAYTYCQTFPTKGKKEIRAQSIRGRMAMSGLYYLKGSPWEGDLLSELLSFPAGRHDDQVDALGLIGQMLDDITGGKAAEKDKKAAERPDDYRAAYRTPDDYDASNWKTY